MTHSNQLMHLNWIICTKYGWPVKPLFHVSISHAVNSKQLMNLLMSKDYICVPTYIDVPVCSIDICLKKKENICLRFKVRKNRGISWYKGKLFV